MRERLPAPDITLYERDMPLAVFTQCLLGLARPGASGRCLLLQGEAGVGKTSLLRAASATAPPGVDWLSGLCEPLLSPTPLGPLLDMLDDLPPSLAAMVRSGRAVQDVMPELLAWLRRLQRPLVLVVDDAQWADGASLDLLRFLGRRIESLRVLLVLSYRSDELPADHPLRSVVAGLPPAATQRLLLEPLSVEAVAQAARRAGRKPQGLHPLTQGNPFFLTELLAAPRTVFPASVRDAVLARVQRLSPRGRRLLEVLSVSPVALERAVLAGLVGGAEELNTALDEGLASGLMVTSDETLAFRHELARRAIESALVPARRRELHRQMLAALPAASATRRVHHAEGAGMTTEVLRLAPEAAAQAAQASAHRQAALLYELALAHCNAHSHARLRAGLLLAWAEQCELVGALARSSEARSQAVALYRQLGDTAQHGLSLCGLARLQWFLGDPLAGKRLAHEAIQVLEPGGPTPALAKAYAVMAQLHLLDATHVAAAAWGHRALALAEQTDDSETLVHALNTVGSSELAGADRAESWSRLRSSLALSHAKGWPEHVARAYVNLIVHALVYRDAEQWRSLCDQALAYCEARDFDLFVTRVRIRGAYGCLETGQWDAAERQLQELLAQPELVAMDLRQTEYLLALLALRRGAGGAARSYWLSLLAKRTALHPEPWYAPVAVACTEAAWLLGRREDMLRTARQALPQACATGEPWRCGQLAVWLHRLGQLDERPGIPLAPPCEAELRGDLDTAAALWAAVGNPWEQGLCLLRGQAGQLRTALALFEQLGAAPAAAMARARLRELGLNTGLRGPNKATRADPQGLTPRERRLLGELAQGLSDRAIAALWHRSPRTVEHHVARLLAKLGVRSRQEAVGLGCIANAGPGMQG